MFGMGGSEILVILIVALIFLGPDKLPDAAKQLSKALRGLRKQTREIQDTIENDTQIGGALRDLKSALRGDELRAPFEDMKRQVNQAVAGVSAPAAAAAATAAAAPAAPAAPVTVQPATEVSQLPLPPDVPPEPAPGEPTDALPVFRPPANTFAKGALAAAPEATADGKAQAAAAADPTPTDTP